MVVYGWPLPNSIVIIQLESPKMTVDPKPDGLVMLFTSKYSRLLWPMLLWLLAFWSGCSTINSYLGADGDYLLKAYDQLALPGEKSQLHARLESGTIQRDLPNRRIRFRGPGWFLRTTTTDDEGYAVTDFTPRRPGNYIFTIEVETTGLESRPPQPVELLVTCRASAEPMIIVDLDKTLAQTRSWRFFTKNPAPMPGSVAVMRRLAKDYTVVYVTHRPQQYAHQTKVWLRTRGYPRGPLLMPEVIDFARGSRRYKTKELRHLKNKFPNIRIGIGDKIADALAYHGNGLKSFLILDSAECDDPEDYLELAQELDRLPADVQVVYNWPQIESAIYQGQSFPRSAAQEELRKKSEALRYDIIQKQSRKGES